MKSRKILYSLAIFILGFLFCSISAAEPESQVWQKLDDGLYLGEFEYPKQSPIVDYPIIVLKIDPKLYSFKLLSASEYDDKRRTAKQWCKEYGLIAAINASMYCEDYITSTGYMKNYSHINNATINPRFGAFMVFNPANSSVPSVQIIDRYHQNWRDLIKDYSTVIQNYRMITLEGKNAWNKKKQEKVYSTAAIGIDKNGDVLFIFSKVPYSTHDFNNILLELPINIKNAMYVEGGSEATLYCKVNEEEIKWFGNYETGFNKNNKNESVCQIPNVVGIVKR